MEDAVTPARPRPQPEYLLEEIRDLIRQLPNLPTEVERNRCVQEYVSPMQSQLSEHRDVLDRLDGDDHPLSVWMIHELYPSIRDLYIVARDGLLDYLRLDIVSRQVEAADYRAHLAEVIQEAKREIIAMSYEVKVDINNSNRLYYMHMQRSVVPELKRQLQSLSVQLSDAVIQHDELSELRDLTDQLHRRVEMALEAADQRYTHIQRVLLTTDQRIEEEQHRAGGPRVETLIHRLSELEAEAIAANDLAGISTEIDPYYARFPERTEIITNDPDSDQWILSTVPMRQRVQQWIESEVMPQLYELSSRIQILQSHLTRTLTNARNRLQIYAAQMEEDAGSLRDALELIQETLRQEEYRVEQESQGLDGLAHNIKELVEGELHINQIYRQKGNYLNLPSSVLASGSLRSSRIGLEGLREIVQTPRLWLQRLNRHTRIDRSMTDSESLVRFLRAYRITDEHHHYTSIFTLRGFIGDSFVIDREEELHQIEQNLVHWREGYRGSIVIQGPSGSGKSLLAELAATRYAMGPVIRLVPGEKLELSGRSIELGYQLSTVLEQVHRLILTERRMILIDDLERWWSQDISLYENIKQLHRFIDQHSQRHCFIVTMHRQLWWRGLKVFDFQRHYQSILSLGPMSYEHFWEMISVRHSATHQSCIDPQTAETLPIEKLQDRAREIHKISDGIPGLGLRLWAGSTDRVDEDRMRLKEELIREIPDILEPDTAQLIRMIYQHGSMNEYTLRRRFGAAFNDHYIHILRRLLSTGVLYRNTQSRLGINELLAYLLEKELIKRYEPSV